MNKHGELFFGIILGAVMMYLLDPSKGRRRRALVRDQIVHGAHELEDFGGSAASTARHLRNRARGAVIETRSRFRREEVDDPILEARVRSELGRLTADISDVAVSAEHGRVTLRGSAPEDVMNALVEGVQAVPGVHDVINRLRARESTS